MAFLNRVEVGLERAGTVVMVPNHPKAKLMYYLGTVAGLVDAENDPNIRRLIDYDNYRSLTATQTQQLLVLCVVLSPDVLVNKVIFEDDEMCGNSSNEFYNLRQVSHRYLVANSIVIGGRQQRVTQIMTFKKSWLRQNYYEPIQHFQREMEEQRRRRAVERAIEEACVIQ